MNLIIVESPTKARTLTKYLNGQYRVEATIGHIRDLPKAALGVDTDHDYHPSYIIPKDKAKRVGELKDIAAKADSIILATDPDREGEAIAWHVGEILRDKEIKRSKDLEKGKRDKSPDLQISRSANLARIVFHEITEHAIKEALKNPRTLDLQLVNAQQARRVLDRLVGYKLSPLLWQKLSRKWLSAGRVQSVAVRFVVEREREIEKFSKEEFWTIEGTFQSAHEDATPSPNSLIHATLISKDGQTYEKTLTHDLFDGKYTTTSSTISTQSKADSIVRDLQAPFVVSAVDKKEIRRYPYPPYTTSTLQIDAGRKLYFSAKRTMQLAQQLYEEGFITYHRTDSVHLSEKFISESRDYIRATYGIDFLPEHAKRYQTKSKVAQEAHEAIRPTDVNLRSLPRVQSRGSQPTPSAVEGFTAYKKDINKDHVRLYELIWKRAVGCQAREAVFDATTVAVTSSNSYRFVAQGSVIKFDGFLRIVGRDGDDVLIPDVVQGQKVTLTQTIPTQHFTNPPPRYTEASLIKTLEGKGIGRPSTYAPILSTVIERQYIVKEERKLKPTDLGNLVTDFLIRYFPNIMDPPFTATIEDSLDDIANGVKQWIPVIDAFYKPFAEDLARASQQAEKVKMPVEETGQACPDCGNPLVIRTGRYGKFFACSTFPKCTYTKQVADKIDKKCPRCSGDIVIKRSKRGKTFYGCSSYPKCTFAAWKKEDIK